LAKSVIDIIIEAQNNASRELKRFRSDMETLQQNAGTLQDMSYGFLALGGAVTAGLGYAVKTTADFEQALADTASVMGRTAGDWKDLEAIAREFGRTTSFTATESANAMKLLAQFGYGVDQMEDMLKSTINLSTALNYDLEMATEIVVSTMKNFEKQGYSSSRVAEIFAKATNISSASMEKFRYTLKYVAPIANQLNYSLEDTVGILSMLYDAGIPAETAGTSLRQALSRLVDPTKEASKVLQANGLTLKEINPMYNDFATILDRLGKANLDTAELFTVFGDEATSAMSALIDKGSGKLREYQKQLKESGGVLEQMKETQLATFNGQMKLLKSAVEDVAIGFGMMMLPALTDFVKMLKVAVDWFNGLSTETKKTIGYIILGVGAFSLLSGVILLTVGTWVLAIRTVREFGMLIGTTFKYMKNSTGVGKVIGLIAKAFRGLGTAVLWLGRIMLMNPIGLAITAIVALVTLLYFAWTKNWGGIQEKTQAVWSWMKQTWNNIVSGAENLITGITRWFSELPSVIRAFFIGAWESAVEWVSTTIQNIRNAIYQGLINILMDTGQTQSEAVQTLQNAWSNITSFFSGLWEFIRFIFWDRWVQIGSEMLSQVNYIVETTIIGFNDLVADISAWGRDMWTVIVNAFRSFYEAIRPYLVAIGNFFRSVWNGIVTFFRSVWTIIHAVATSFVMMVWTTIKTYFGLVASFWKGVWNGIVAFFRGIGNTLKQIVAIFMTAIKNTIAFWINLIAGNWRQAWNNLKNILNSYRSILPSTVRGILSAISSAIKSFGSTVYKSGKSLMDAFARGIRDAVGKVTSAVSSVVTKARRFFGFSDAKEGAFSNITYSGYATMSAFAEGATKAKSLLARSIGGTLSSAMSGGLAGNYAINGMNSRGLAGSLNPRRFETSDTSKNEFNITINASSDDLKNPEVLVDRIIREIERRMRG